MVRPPRHLPLAAAAAIALLAAAPARGQQEEVWRPAGAPVVVGANHDYPPYEFVGKDGKPAGFNVDLTRAIAEVMGMQVEFRVGRWSELRAALLTGEVDVLQGLTWSEERAKILDFAPPHAIVHHSIFARVDGPQPASIDDLQGREVVVFRGGIMDETLTARGLGEKLIRVDNAADALRLLAAGKHDAVALATLPGIWNTRELGLSNVVPVGPHIAAERYGYAVKKGNAELLARFDEGLAILKKTGRYELIQAQWLGVLEPQRMPWEFMARFGAFVLVPLLLLLGGSFVWNRSLKKEVALRTQSLAREVAERERAVEELRLHQQQMVQADKMAALGVLVAGVAHEINNPNGFILLNMPILKAAFKDAGEILDEHQQASGDFRIAGLPYSRMREEIPRMLDEMIAGGRRIKHIVQDLKDFARREDAPRLEPTDLNEVARAATRLVEAQVRKATRRFELRLGEGLPLVRANAQRIEQVIVNLLLNACEALPDPGRAVRLVTRHDRDEGAVSVEVVDEGVGIPPEQIPRVFEPFFTTKRESGGTGLGLSVSAGIVKEHGGRLEFRSTVGAGTTATLTLPAAKEVAA